MKIALLLNLADDYIDVGELSISFLGNIIVQSVADVTADVSRVESWAWKMHTHGGHRQHIAIANLNAFQRLINRELHTIVWILTGPF